MLHSDHVGVMGQLFPAEPQLLEFFYWSTDAISLEVDTAFPWEATLAPSGGVKHPKKVALSSKKRTAIS